MQHRIARRIALAVILMAAIPVAPATLSGQADAQKDAPSAVERALESRSKGSPDATVVVFEIADFQCPYCADFVESIAPDLHAGYVDAGLIQWVFVNLPLQNHPYAWHAAEAALCAGAAGDRFWPMHDRLFAEQDNWSEADDVFAAFTAYAAELDVPAEPFRKCVVNDEVASLILQDVGSVVSAGITGTPTFIIMKDQQVVERLVGLHSVSEWARILDEALGR